MNNDTNRQQVIKAFESALKWGKENEDIDDGCGELHEAAFDLAEKLGWDWSEDEVFMGWCLKATSVECLEAGLRRALDVMS